MLNWILALAIGAVVAWLTYSRVRDASATANVALAVVRALAVAVVAALLLGAPIAPPQPAPPVLAIDASQSWRRTHDSANVVTRLRALARDVMQQEGADQVVVFGDSLREGDAGLLDDITPSDSRSPIRAVVDRAAAIGRPLVVLTDGEVDDAAAFEDAPAGSRVVIDTARDGVDLAVLELRIATAAAAGDTVDAEVDIGAGAVSTARAQLQLRVDGRTVTTASVTPLQSFATTRLPLRVPLPRTQGVVLVHAVLALPDDTEAHNDTLATAIEITDRPPVAFVSTAPDLDVREVLRVLRGSLDLPVRAYLRIAPQLWREEGSLAAVSEADVRSRALRAGLVVVHGDTTWGGVASNARGARALWTPAPPLPPARAGEIQRVDEWYPSGAPASPLSAALAGLPWDTLPPIALAGAARGEFAVLDVRLGRSGDAVAAIAGRESGATRTIVVSGSGYAGWALRGGRPSEAFTAMWGAIFDWLAVARGDERAVRPVAVQLRAGEPVRWRRVTADTVHTVVIRKRSADADADSLQLRFAGDALETESASLGPGVYDVQVAGGTSVLVVNASREWLPRSPTMTADMRKAGTVTTDAPTLAERGWPFILALLLLCAEWIGRRFAGLR